MSDTKLFAEICSKHPPHKPLVNMFLDEVTNLRARIAELEKDKTQLVGKLKWIQANAYDAHPDLKELIKLVIEEVT